MFFQFSVGRILGRKVGRAEGVEGEAGRQAWQGDGWDGCHACYTIHMLK